MRRPHTKRDIHTFTHTHTHTHTYTRIIYTFTHLCAWIYLCNSLSNETRQGCNGSDSRVINSRTDGDSACLQIGRRLPVITTIPTSISSCEFAYIVIYIYIYVRRDSETGRSVFPSRADTSVDREKLISIPRLPCKRKTTIVPYI